MRWLAVALLVVAPVAGSGEAEWQQLLANSRENLARSQEALEKDFQLGGYNGRPVVSAAIVFVGSYAAKSGTWLWAWANESVLGPLTRNLDVVREYGEAHGFRLLVERGWTASGEEEGWDLAAVANYILGGKGVYRVPSRSSVLWMVMTDIRRVP